MEFQNEQDQQEQLGEFKVSGEENNGRGLRIFFRVITVILVGALLIGIGSALANRAPNLPVPVTVYSPDVSGKSLNWSGYVANGGIFTSVTGTWTVPNINSSNSETGLAADATWVGIGGLTSHDLIQVGTQAIVDSSGVNYQAWYEMLPSNSRYANLSVNAGDSITATVTNTGGNNWQITLKDNTTGKSFQISAKYNSSESSADWIEEVPSDGGRLLTLSDFGSINFTGVSTVKNGQEMTAAQAQAHKIVMQNYNGQIIADPSALGTDGLSFAISRTNASSVQPVAFRSRRSGIYVLFR